MNQWMNQYFDKDCGCAEGACDCEVDFEEEEDMLIEIVDSETGETFSFYLADEFEYEGESYGVLVTTDAEEPEYVIGRMVEDGEDGDFYVETLDDEENEVIYDVYEAILEASFEEEEEEEA